MSNLFDEQQALLHFIRTYRNLSLLWDPSSKDYSNKLKRYQAYEKLLKIYRNVKPNATEKDVKKKINILRTNFKKQLKKIDESLSNGSEKIFEPQSWSFKELGFLAEISSSSVETSEKKQTKFRTHRTSENDILKIKSFADNYIELGESELKEFEKFDCHELEDTEPFPSSDVEEKVPIGVESQKYVENDQMHKPNEVLDIVSEYLNKNDNETFVIAKSWSVKLARLKLDQRIWAEKFISDILTEGELGTLRRNSVRINDSFA